MTDTHTPIMIDEVHSTDIYVATLELRSVGTSKNLYPVIKFSHHFTSEPEFVPYSYRAVMQIAEKIGAIVETKDAPEVRSESDINSHVLEMEEVLQGEGDDTIH